MNGHTERDTNGNKQANENGTANANTNTNAERMRNSKRNLKGKCPTETQDSYTNCDANEAAGVNEHAHGNGNVNAIQI